MHLWALGFENGKWLILATFRAPNNQAINAHADRWPIEIWFDGLKKGSFNLEDTPPPQKMCRA